MRYQDETEQEQTETNSNESLTCDEGTDSEYGETSGTE